MNPFATEVSIVVGLLVKGEYSVIEAMTQGQYLTADEMRIAITEYGRTLAVPPSDVWDELDVIEGEGVEPATFHVDFPLWTEEEGESDLTVQLELTEFFEGTYKVAVTGIHAL